MARQQAFSNGANRGVPVATPGRACLAGAHIGIIAISIISIPGVISPGAGG